MTLPTHSRRVTRGEDEERELVVACPQRIDPVSLQDCAQCELCEGLELDGRVGVRCAVEPADALEGSPGPGAAISSIMTRQVVTVLADASLENIQWLLLERGIGAVPVVDAASRPIGILSKSDLLRERDEPRADVKLADPDLDGEDGRLLDTSGLTARDVMTPVVHAVLERTSIAATAAVMARERVHHVLVVSDTGSLRGICSTFDLVRWVAARDRFAPRAR